MGILFTCCPGLDKGWGSAGPQTGQVTLEGPNGSKVKARWLGEDYNIGKCWVKTELFDDLRLQKHSPLFPMQLL